MSRQRRGQCPECLGIFTLKLDGTLYSHHATVYRDSTPDADAKRCPGAGEPPRIKRPLWR